MQKSQTIHQKFLFWNKKILLLFWGGGKRWSPRPPNPPRSIFPPKTVLQIVGQLVSKENGTKWTRDSGVDRIKSWEKKPPTEETLGMGLYTSTCYSWCQRVSSALRMKSLLLHATSLKWAPIMSSRKSDIGATIQTWEKPLKAAYTPLIFILKFQIVR